MCSASVADVGYVILLKSNNVTYIIVSATAASTSVKMTRKLDRNQEQ